MHYSNKSKIYRAAKKRVKTLMTGAVGRKVYGVFSFCSSGILQTSTCAEYVGNRIANNIANNKTLWPDIIIYAPTMDFYKKESEVKRAIATGIFWYNTTGINNKTHEEISDMFEFHGKTDMYGNAIFQEISIKKSDDRIHYCNMDYRYICRMLSTISVTYPYLNKIEDEYLEMLKSKNPKEFLKSIRSFLRNCPFVSRGDVARDNYTANRTWLYWCRYLARRIKGIGLAEYLAIMMVARRNRFHIPVETSYGDIQESQEMSEKTITSLRKIIKKNLKIEL